MHLSRPSCYVHERIKQRTCRSARILTSCSEPGLVDSGYLFCSQMKDAKGGWLPTVLYISSNCRVGYAVDWPVAFYPILFWVLTPKMRCFTSKRGRSWTESFFDGYWLMRLSTDSFCHIIFVWGAASFFWKKSMCVPTWSICAWIFDPSQLQRLNGVWPSALFRRRTRFVNKFCQSRFMGRRPKVYRSLRVHVFWKLEFKFQIESNFCGYMACEGKTDDVL